MLAWAGATGAASTIGCSSAAVAPPTTMPVPAAPKPIPPYFSSEDRAVLGALADAVLPPDDTPGGNALGAVDYIEGLLTAFERETPLIFMGGPYSGRTNLPASDGSETSIAPPDDFESFLPLDRVAERAWRLRIYGSQGVPGGGPNDAILGPVIGLRESIASAIAQAKANIPSGLTIGELNPFQLSTILAAIDATTQSALIEAVLEGCFTAPEYGGNKNLAGWALCNFEGDSQPYGYSTYDETTGKYIDRPDHPCASPNPGPDPVPLTAATENLLKLAFAVLGGKTFTR
jgi:Gluconate 2-dehydrogenase subunit 3